MYTFIVAFALAIAVAIVTRILYAMFGSSRRRPAFGSMTFFGILLLGFVMSWAKHDNLITENRNRIDQWTANQCVDPDQIARSVFAVDMGGGRGTGFMTAGNTLITNRHVAEGAGAEALAYTNADAEYTGLQLRVADSGTGPDIAFYYLPDASDIPALPIADVPVQRGDQLLIVGHPQFRPNFYVSAVNVVGTTPEELESVELSTISESFSWVMSTLMELGLPSTLTDEGARSNASFIVHGDLGPGSSGSALVNCQGEVVGVLFAGVMMPMTASDSYGAAVTLEDLKAELGKLPPVDEPLSVS